FHSLSLHDALPILLALELLNIVRVRHPKSVLRGNLKTGTFARFHTLDAGLESRGQITIAKLKYGRLITDRGVHNVTAFQLKGKVHGDLAAMPHKKFCHKSASTRPNWMLRLPRECGTCPRQSLQRRR